MEVKPAPCAVIKIEKNDRVYQFLVPADAPLGELYDVMHAMLQHVTKSASQAADKVKREFSDTEKGS